MAHAVDGLRTTLSDPAKNTAYAGEPETSWESGQTAVLMDPIPVVPFIAAVRRLMVLETIHGTLSQDQVRSLLTRRKAEWNAWETAHKSFRDALQRSLDLARDRRAFAQVALNGMRYVNECHSWKTIGPLYTGPLEHAARLARDARP